MGYFEAHRMVSTYSNNNLEHLLQLLLAVAIPRLVAAHAVADIGKQRREVGDFEFLVKGDGLEGLDGAVGQFGWGGGVGQSATGLHRDVSQLLGIRGGKAIRCLSRGGPGVGREGRRGASQGQSGDENLCNLGHFDERGGVMLKLISSLKRCIVFKKCCEDVGDDAD